MENKPKKQSKPRAKKPGMKARNPRQSKPQNLPEPVEISAPRVPLPLPGPAPDADGILAGIGNLFSPEKAPSQPDADFAPGSKITSDSLPPESERLLHAVPDVIGSEADDPVGPAQLPDQDPVAALMAQVAFEPQFVQDLFEEFHSYLARLLDSEHWEMTDRQARMIRGPATQLLNSMWTNLQSYLPDIFSRWCEQTPGATAFFLAISIVDGPKIPQQIAISRERARQRPLVQEKPKPTPIQSARPPQPPVGIVFDGSSA